MHRIKAEELLAPLRSQSKAWTPSKLGTWNVDDSCLQLERFDYEGAPGGTDYYQVGIFAGIHGDELAGVIAATRLLSRLANRPHLARGYRLSIYPLCNPSGFDRGTRQSRSGHDLNREFWIGSSQPEVLLLEREIRSRHFDGIISLHADDESAGLYAFALGAQVTEYVVEPALRAAERILPRNCDPVIDNFVADNGLIRKGYPGMLCAAPEQSPRPFEIVFETPVHAELESQVEANLIFLEHALDQYLQLQAVGQDL